MRSALRGVDLGLRFYFRQALKGPPGADVKGAALLLEAPELELLPTSELEFLEPLKLSVSMKPGVSLIGNAMKTKS
jgi:hypothetical protein